MQHSRALVLWASEQMGMPKFGLEDLSVQLDEQDL